MKDWITYILEGLVSEPDNLTVEETNDEMGTLFTISSTSKEDIGVMIGRNAEHVKAIRTILRIHGFKNDIKASIKIKTLEE